MIGRDSKDSSVSAAEGANVNVNRLGMEPATLIVVTFLGLVIGACGLVMGLNLAKQDFQDREFHDLQTRYMLLERRYVDMEAYALLNGWKIPSDDTHGPTGNLMRMKPKGDSDGRR